MKLRITVDSKAYEVEVDILEDDTGGRNGGHAPPAASRPASVSGGSAAAASAAPAKSEQVQVEDESKVVRSPVMGIVVKVTAQPGQEIQADDPLIVLEAMKMESSITSPITGKIKSVTVRPGDSVENGQILVIFE